jgi:hypothetical protein
MIYIPSALEETVRQWVQTGREVEELLDFISQQSLEQLLQQKERALGRGSAPSRRPAKRKEPPP